MFSATLVFGRGHTDPLAGMPAGFGFQTNQHAVAAPLGSHNAAAAKSFLHIHKFVFQVGVIRVGQMEKPDRRGRVSSTD
jgi:hypothetical protein